MATRSRLGNQVVIANEVAFYQIKTKYLYQIVQVLLQKLGYRNTWLSLVLVSDRKIQRINRDFLSHPWKTDVLAFPFSNRRTKKISSTTPHFLGEVIISPARAQVYARKHGISFQGELVRYVCHGVLHLNGYRDYTGRDRRKMEEAEGTLLKILKSKIKRVI